MVTVWVRIFSDITIDHIIRSLYVVFMSCQYELYGNYMEDMISILETYQQYCPQVDGKLIPIPVGGDGLTTKRGEEAQMARRDGINPEARLDGVVLKVEDWHKDTMVMMKVSIHLLIIT